MSELTAGPPPCCPHCSADLRPDGRLCWHCRQPISEELRKRAAPSKAEPALALLPSTSIGGFYYLGRILVILLVCFLALSKGWLTVFGGLPSLALVLPLLLWVQITLPARLTRGTAHPALPGLARGQLLSALLAYAAMPGMGDNSYFVFCFWETQSAGLVRFSSAICAAAAIAFVCETLWFYEASKGK
jgi:hypothetical protein